MEFKININRKHFIDKLNAFHRRLAQVEGTPRVLTKIGQIIASRGIENIEEGSPDGRQSFKTLDPATIARKVNRNPKPLVDTGELKKISHHTEGKSLFIGMAEYGIYHISNKKRTKLPRRNFLNIRNHDIIEIENYIAQFIQQK